MPRIISEQELNEEASRRTIRCNHCRLWIRYKHDEVITDKPRNQRHLICPNPDCGKERVVAIGGIRDAAG